MDRWPLPGRWSAVDKARLIAHEYRKELLKVAPETCRHLDAMAAAAGQGWVTPQPVRFDDDDFVAPLDAADLVDRSLRTIYNWVADGSLPSYPERGKIRVRVADARRVDAERRACAE